MSWMYSSASFNSAGVTGECWKIWSHTWAQLCTDAMTFSILDHFHQPTYSTLLFKMKFHCARQLYARLTNVINQFWCRTCRARHWCNESLESLASVQSIFWARIQGRNLMNPWIEFQKLWELNVEVVHHSKVSAAYWCHCMTYQLLWQTTRLLVSTGWVYVLSHANCPVMDDILIIPDISDRQRGWTLQAVQVQSTWTLFMIPCRV